ncbi:3'-5' exoribonuclease YhaM family protein [Thermodesulforhabdus norvegica]
MVRLKDELRRVFYGKLSCRYYRALWDAFLLDKELQKGFVKAPGAVKIHHSYLGGLLQHTVGVLRLVDAMCDIYRELNRDLILTGALLHDIGKIREYSYDLELGVTDEGRLLGHIVIGLQIFDSLLKKVGSIPEEKSLLLRHLIASHHGQLEFGSPKVPMTREALVLHFADNIDARLNELNRLYDETEKQTLWTPYQQRYGTQFYIGPDSEVLTGAFRENNTGSDKSAQLSLDEILKQRTGGI